MKLYNTLTRKVEDFEPRSGRKVLMYTCGLTVYSQPQIGNWVAYIYADVLDRVLVANGFEVLRIQNITDVGHLVSDDDSGEDKLQKGANKEGTTAWEIAKKYSAVADREAFNDLGLLRPSKIVSATSRINEQIDFAKQLEDKGFTYVIEGEGLYFDTSKIKDYGKLAKLDIEGLNAGSRVPIKGKHNVTDFAIWKSSPKNAKRDMEWESPWGVGFPGWHLECSSIILSELGEQIDIHTGGIDHIPVHHTNEIAQSEALTKKPLAKYWFHNNFMLINGEKMAKSTGNSYVLSDLTSKGFSLDAFKLLVISSHYRTAGNFTWEILESAQNRLNNWKNIINLKWQTVSVGKESENTSQNPGNALLDLLSNDLDTPGAVSYIDTCLTQSSKLSDVKQREAQLTDVAHAVDSLLGINLLSDDISGEQKSIISARNAARAQKDWPKSDELRDNLASQGVLLNDVGDSSIWSRSYKAN